MAYQRHRYRFTLNLFRTLVIAATLFATLGSPAPAEASTFVVNSLWDDDDGVCDSTHCTLREAINAANANPMPDTIWFNFESGSPNYMIRVDDELPRVTDSGTVIDASTMPPFEGGPSVVIVGDEDVDYGILLESSGNTVRGLKFSGFTGEGGGAGIYVQSDENLIEFTQYGSNTYGIVLRGNNNTVRDSFIGLIASGSAAPNAEHGIQIIGDNNLIIDNTIAYNGGAGIYMSPGHGYRRNTFSHNLIYDNVGLGIDNGGNNEDINFPLIMSTSSTEVSGEACRECTVEIYRAAPDPTDYGEAIEFLGEGSTGGTRSFTITLDHELSTCDQVTATATDSLGNTSEFSLNDRNPVCMHAVMPPLSEPYLTVNTEDDVDDGVCNEEHCSLREAINEANRFLGADSISFDIPGPPVHRIELTRSLPPLTNDQTTIDGTTEPDYTGEPVIILDGRIADVEVGLRVESQRNLIRGIFFSHFGDVESHATWTEITGGAIVLEGGLNRIENNQIAFNAGHGIDIGSDYNVVTGNVIGLDEDGLTAWENHGHGIHIRFSSDFNTIGGAEPGEGNIISGNLQHGINIHFSEGNRVLGNIIGSNERGEVAIPNGGSGIFTQGAGEIGGLNPGEGNIILGNTESGIVMWDTAYDMIAAGNIIHDNEEFGIEVDTWVSEEHIFTRNSIYNNGDLGIRTELSDDHVPRIDLATTSEVSGVTCRGCLVEVFLAEPDPTGYGEGKTYLGEDRADIAGEWSVDISGVEVCDEITATSTKSGEGTSEFAENALASCLRMRGAPLGVMSAGIFLIVIALFLVGRTIWPNVPYLTLPLGALVGVVSSAGFILLLVLIPGMDVDFSGGPEPPPAPLPGCSQYVDLKSILPSDGHVFELEEDPLLQWQVADELPVGEVHWRVDLRIPDQSLLSLTTDKSELNFSTFDLEPRPGGRYDWYLSGELTSSDGTEFEPFCDTQAMHFFKFVNPLIVEVAQVEEPSIEETDGGETPPDEEACTPTVMATMNATCRFGPNKEFRDLGYLLEGATAAAEAQTFGAGWFKVLLDNKVNCWVWSGAVEATCIADLPIQEGPPLPTKEPTKEPTTEPVDVVSPPAPNILSPKNGETVGCAASVPLKWSAVDDPSGIAGYTVQVEQSPMWTSYPGSPFATSNTGLIISVECGGFYRWRVRAKDGVGNVGPWSSWAEFSVILP